ncbi:ImmA/IrrE family metallo-endopeptidase [Deinococcus peraridilitoris]|uniref:ImmA/IrrE family metallo-endopeptidase n=1 Tax=Deinococcus peraridilitoris TaxID=432329 RepID=UPI00059D3DB9|nr:ImmA/IrrE family metallo-endopeptidase [Deinococcus peraridilitoris]
MLDDELSLHQIRDAFLREVERRHAEHEFTTDYRALAQRLGVTVVAGRSNQAITTSGERFIVVDEQVAEQRARFSGLHEIAHHLFEESEDGYLRARLKDIFHHSPEAAKHHEEDLCDAAAALLLMPNHLLQEAVRVHGHSPLTALFLVTRSGASAQAALRRVMWHRDVPSFGVLMNAKGLVLDSVNHGHAKSYPIGRNFLVEEQHALRTSSFAPDIMEMFDAPVPFSNGNRGWIMRVRACLDGRGRTLAFFNRAEHVIRIDDRQPALF